MFFDVDGLDEGEEYLFRVSAVNELGESDPLEADQAIKAKNPFGKFSIHCIYSKECNHEKNILGACKFSTVKIM